MITTGVENAAFTSLCSHLKQWFYQPDIEALEIVLAVAASHYSDGDPTWLFIVGPPATGKTSGAIQALRYVPQVYLVGDLTPQTFLSGKAKRNGNSEPSLLMKLGSAILLVKDFTTLISKRPDDRAMIVSQLREIYDGTFTKDTGESGRIYWSGKMTVIAACTYAIERQWAILRDLGERFMTVRWMREPGVPSGRQAMRQCGHEVEIAAKTAKLGQEALERLNNKSRPALPGPLIDRILALGEIVALARNHVVRDSMGSRDIIDLSPAEGPSRIVKALRSVIVNYAAMFQRDPTQEDMRLAIRLATNSIPSRRFSILSSIPCDTEMEINDIIKLAQMPRMSLLWQLDELEALSLLVKVSSGDVTTYRYSKNLQELWEMAFPSLTASIP